METGTLYRNPKPHLRSVHAYHPSLVPLGGGELLATFDLGAAPEALDYRTWAARSRDDGRTWSLEGPLFTAPAAPPTTSSVRVARLPDGTLYGFGARWRRDDPEEGLTNRATLGFVPMELIALRSTDGGRTWSGPEPLVPPLEGPAFEICSAVVVLPEGDLLVPTSTWPGWDGTCPGGPRAVVLRSSDGGRTWSDHAVVFDRAAEGIVHWEHCVAPLPDGRLVATAWSRRLEPGENLPTPYSISRDRGRSWEPPCPTGLRAQTCKLLALGADRLLAVYRRDDLPGLWATRVRVLADRWELESTWPLWQGALSGMSGGGSAADALSALRFGYPSPARLEGGDVLVAFWCVEELVSQIRWIRLPGE